MFQRFIDKLFRDKQGHVVILQRPNLPLWGWIVCKLLGVFLHGQPGTIVSIIGTLTLTVWAVLEIGWGSSLFRRLLGSAVLISIVAGGCVKLWR